MEHFVKGQKVRVVADHRKSKNKKSDFIGQTGVVERTNYHPDTLDNNIVVVIDSIKAPKYFVANELELIKEENKITKTLYVNDVPILTINMNVSDVLITGVSEEGTIPIADYIVDTLDNNMMYDNIDDFCILEWVDEDETKN